jgi:uncharacterized membrane protein (UPF0127 family)
VSDRRAALPNVSRALPWRDEPAVGLELGVHMPRPLCFIRIVLVAAFLETALTAQIPAPRHAPTPPPTTSDECPAPAVDTKLFLSASTVDVRTPRGRIALVPVTQEKTRARGLMCVVSVPPGKGMLFVFAPPQHAQNFWMKNTLVDLDMVFVAASGAVTGVAADVPATPRGTPDDAVERREGVGLFVIELGAGDAARQGIRRGTKLALPTLTAEE